MKKIINFFLLLSCLVMTACQTNNSSEQANENGFIAGEVIEMEFGKDGYNAKVESPGGKVYQITMSPINIQPSSPEAYREFIVGQHVKFKGEAWGENHENITVREFETIPWADDFRPPEER